MIIPTKYCQGCGQLVDIGVKYCKSCALEYDDFSGYLDLGSLPDIPLWVFKLIFFCEFGVLAYICLFII